jgi:hypothetical protein
MIHVICLGALPRVDTTSTSAMGQTQPSLTPTKGEQVLSPARRAGIPTYSAPVKAIAIALLVFATGCASSATDGEVRGHAIRLVPGDDLRVALEKFVRDEKIEAGFVMTCAGSLRRAAIRFADAKEAALLDGPFEIVSLSGTFSPDGAHVHIAISPMTTSAVV